MDVKKRQIKQTQTATAADDCQGRPKLIRNTTKQRHVKRRVEVAAQINNTESRGTHMAKSYIYMNQTSLRMQKSCERKDKGIPHRPPTQSLAILRKPIFHSLTNDRRSDHVGYGSPYIALTVFGDLRLMAIISVSNGARAVILPLRQTGDIAAEQHAITCEALEKLVKSNRKNP